MPKLTMFAPCDNVLVSGSTETISLISVLTGVMFPGAQRDDVEPGTLAPMRWFLFSSWIISQEDRDKSFEQRIRLVGQDEETYLESTAQFQLKHDRVHHRMIGQLFGFPVVPAGEYYLKLEVREAEGQWDEVADYPMAVGYSA